MLGNFNDKAENLNDIMTEMVGGIKKITEAIDRNNEVTEQLSDTTQKFTML